MHQVARASANETQSLATPRQPGELNDAAECPSANSSAAAGSNGALRSTAVARPVRPWHRLLIRQLLSLVGKPPLSAALWDGQIIRASGAAPLATIFIHNAATLRRLALNPFYQFGEAYANGQIDIVGDLVEVLLAIDRSVRASQAATFLYDVATKWLRFPRLHSLSASRDNVYHHYDIGNDFYRLWLDEQLAYTCAYFPDAERFARSRAGRQVRSRLPQARAAARRARRRGRLRLGRRWPCTWRGSTG